MKTYLGIALCVFGVCMFKGNIPSTYAQIDTGLVMSIVSGMPTMNKLLLLADTLNRHPLTYEDLEDTLVAALPIIEFDHPPNHFMDKVISWALHHLPNVLSNGEFQGIMKIFIDELNNHNATDDWELNSGNFTEDRDFYINKLFSVLDYHGMAQKIIQYQSVRNFFMYNSTDRPLDGQCYFNTIGFFDRLFYGVELALNNDRLDASIVVDCNKYTWDIIVDLDKLRQVYPKAKGSDIYLGENKCSGIEKNNLLIFNHELTECLTTERLINGVHVYNNELIYAEHDPVHLYIIRHYNWTVGVECDVQRDGTVNSSLQRPDEYTPSPSVNNQQYSVNMSYYSDPNFVYEIQGNPLHVNVGSQVYVKVFTTTADWNTKMRVHTCYTTPTEHALDHLKYYLIQNGCEVDTNTHITSQSTHETRLVFDDFEYTSSHNGLYVYCDVTFCASTDWSTNCRQTCQPVVRRKR